VMIIPDKQNGEFPHVCKGNSPLFYMQSVNYNRHCTVKYSVQNKENCGGK
jgi:hypothetical protein